MNLDQFGLTRAAFELRFEPAFPLWDRTGAIWTEARANWPRLEHDQVSPNLTTFWLDRPYIQLAVHLDKILVLNFLERDGLNEYIEVAAAFVPIVTRHLDLEVFSRVGFRLIYRRDFDTIEEASDAVLKLGLVAEPKHCGFAKGRRLLQPLLMLRWEDDDIGVRLSVEARRVEKRVIPPVDHPQMKPEDIIDLGVVIDVDHFTKGNVATGQLDLTKWMPARVRETREVLRQILEE